MRSAGTAPRRSCVLWTSVTGHCLLAPPPPPLSQWVRHPKKFVHLKLVSNFGPLS